MQRSRSTVEIYIYFKYRYGTGKLLLHMQAYSIVARSSAGKGRALARTCLPVLQYMYR